MLTWGMARINPGALAEIRRARHVSQRALSQKIGMSDSYIARVERGDYQPPHDRVRLIARTLRTSIRSITSENAA